jgi:hypothetical protein
MNVELPRAEGLRSTPCKAQARRGRHANQRTAGSDLISRRRVRDLARPCSLAQAERCAEVGGKKRAALHDRLVSVQVAVEGAAAKRLGERALCRAAGWEGREGVQRCRGKTKWHARRSVRHGTTKIMFLCLAHCECVRARPVPCWGPLLAVGQAHLEARHAAAAAQHLDGVDVRTLEPVARQQALQRRRSALPEAGLREGTDEV